MVKLNNYNYLAEIEKDDLSKYKTEDFHWCKPIVNGEYILVIDFKNNIKYTINLLRFFKFRKSIKIGVKYKDGLIRFAVKNNSPEVITVFKAMYIENYEDRIIYLYDELVKYLDKQWKNKNLCDFCDNICVASRNDKFEKYRNEKNGCCGYAFDIDDKKRIWFGVTKFETCKYLEEGKGCTTANTACKIFACKYLRKNKSFYINPKELILLQSFFNKRQRHFLTYDYFMSREMLIEKVVKAK